MGGRAVIAEPNRWLPLFLRICQGPKPPTRHAPDRLVARFNQFERI